MLSSQKDVSKKKKQPQPQSQQQAQPQAKRTSANPSEDFARKRSAETTTGVVQENKRKKTFPAREKQTSSAGGASNSESDKRKRKKHHKKEVIDYSAIQAEKESEPNADPKSKVRSWLLASSQCRPETIRTSGTGLPKVNRLPLV